MSNLMRILGRAVVLSVLILTGAAPGRAEFTQELQFGTGATIPLAWGDYDNDGDLDMAVGHYQAPNKLFVNNGDGTFTEQSQFGSGVTFAVCWGDHDNDGDLDVAVGKGNNQQNLLFTNNGDGTFTQSNQFGLLRTTSVAWGDADNDGDLDLAVGNGILGTSQQSYLYVNNGDGTYTAQPAFGIGQTDSVVWGDFDNDGDLDLASGRGGFGYVGQNYLYVNNGDGTFTERAEFGEKDTASMAWGDYDNDGDLDMAVGNWNAGGCALYVNNGDATFTGHDEFGSHDTNAISWGDADADGDLDVATGNGDFTTAEQNYLYLNNGDGTFTETPEFGLGSTDAVVWGDYDGDGDLDLGAGNEHSPGQNYLYINGMLPQTWLKVHLIGHRHDLGTGYSNRDGIGAKVAVYDAGHVGESGHLLGYREVSASGGFSSQNQIDPYFGLPDRTEVDIRINWPGSGGIHFVQDLPGVATGQRLVVDEAPAGASVGEVPAGLRGSLQIVPNPSPANRVSMTWHLPRGHVWSVRILSPTGTVVREISPGGAPAGGVWKAVWDGRAADGNPAPAGAYRVLVDGTESDLSGGLILVR